MADGLGRAVCTQRSRFPARLVDWDAALLNTSGCFPTLHHFTARSVTDAAARRWVRPCKRRASAGGVRLSLPRGRMRAMLGPCPRFRTAAHASPARLPREEAWPQHRARPGRAALPTGGAAGLWQGSGAAPKALRAAPAASLLRPCQCCPPRMAGAPLMASPVAPSHAPPRPTHSPGGRAPPPRTAPPHQPMPSPPRRACTCASPRSAPASLGSQTKG
mmetsp:Transcript_750/g.1780  ORF Transcript_750/g.1780 Transcript_750/m.1780 type:complete len:218 (-) Transcript_750:809-1462(-)